MCVCHDLNAFRFRKRNLGIENGIGHRVAGLDNRIHGSQIFVEQVKIILDGIPIACSCVCFHRLNVVAVVVPPTTDLTVHIINFPVMRFNQLMLIGSDLLFYSL